MGTEAVPDHAGRWLGELQNKAQINPSVLVIVIILSVVFFCSGVLHIVARCLGRRRAREPSGGLSSPSVSVRGQLQQLFSLHDSGVDQVFIDALPVFVYGSIRGLKDSADCAVCLNEFQNEDKLRLLPKCKHAFHMECIDTWLLTNSTCPLCRRSLLPEAEPVAPPSNPPTCAAAAAADVVPEGAPAQPPPSHGSFRGSFRASLRGSFRFLTDVVAPPPPPPSERLDPAQSALRNPNPPMAIPTPPMTPGPTVCVTEADGVEKTLRVELGKVNSFDHSRRGPSAGTSTMARSYSMGSYEYVVNFASLGRRSQSPEPYHNPEENPPSKPTHRSALSDSVPERASGSHTPGQREDVFWASRGFETPLSLSRVREIMTPSPGWLSSPLQQARAHVHHHEEDHGQIEVADDAADDEHVVEIMCAETQALKGPKVEAPSLRLLGYPLEDRCEEGRCLRQDGEVQHLSSGAERQDKRCDVSVDVPAPVDGGDGLSPSLKKSSSLNWLRGRSKRSLVYCAASPSSSDVEYSTEDKVT